MKSHLKRLAAPGTWPIKRKQNTFIMRPSPAGSVMELSIPIGTAMKEILGLAKTTKEVTRILRAQEVLVDGKRVYDPKRSICILGSIAFPLIKTAYRLSINTKNKLVLLPIQLAEAKQRPCRIQGKTILGAKRIQLNCSSGINLLMQKDQYKRGDTVIIDEKKQVVSHLPMEKGSLVFLFKGTHVGELATIKDLTSTEVLLEEGGKTFETKRNYCIVVGKKKPDFTIIARKEAAAAIAAASKQPAEKPKQEVKKEVKKESPKLAEKESAAEKPNEKKPEKEPAAEKPNEKKPEKEPAAEKPNEKKPEKEKQK